MKQTVQTKSGRYEIIIEKGAFARLAEEIAPIVGEGRLFVVTDDTVDGLYGDALRNHLSGMDVHYLVLPHGEGTKSLSHLSQIYSELALADMTRTDTLLAFGGGVIGDLAGFAAATYLRGIRYIGVPTTLLSQVDSSVGGKVAVNLPEGKNLVGNFYPPARVIIDPELLKTLPERVFNDGMAEVIKYGAIRDEALFTMLEGDISDKMEEIIHRCVDCKRRIVENDEFDTGERMVLNFGHTFGHVMEQLYHYQKYTHGEGVAIGMKRITRKTEEMGLTRPGTAQRLETLLKKYDLWFDESGFDRDAAMKTLFLDKKGSKDCIRYVIIEEIGNAVIRPFPKQDTFLID